jgi:hypothetical protein
MCVNLLRFKTKRELRITTEYVRHVNESELKENIKYLNFDFHGYCGNERYQALKVMAQLCEKQILDDGWLVENLVKKTVQENQLGVFRSNCLDSLDRTNVA